MSYCYYLATKKDDGEHQSSDEEMSAKRLLVPKELQQKVARGHQRQLAELTIVPDIVGDNDITASGNGTLVLQQVLEITNILMVNTLVLRQGP